MGSSNASCSGPSWVNTSSVTPKADSLACVVWGMGLVTANHSYAKTFDSEFLVSQIHFNHLKIRVFRPQLHNGAVTHAFEALHRDFLANARHHYLAIAHLVCGVYCQQVAVENTCVLHTHTADTQQIVGAGGKKVVGDIAVVFDMFLGEYGIARRDATHNRNAVV